MVSFGWITRRKARYSMISYPYRVDGSRHGQLHNNPSSSNTNKWISFSMAHKYFGGTLWGVQKRGTPFWLRVVVGPLDGHKQGTTWHLGGYFKYYFYYINFKNITLNLIFHQKYSDISVPTMTGIVGTNDTSVVVLSHMSHHQCILHQPSRMTHSYRASYLRSCTMMLSSQCHLRSLMS